MKVHKWFVDFVGWLAKVQMESVMKEMNCRERERERAVCSDSLAVELILPRRTTTKI